MSVRIRFCPECGTKLEEVFAFCPECGTNLANVFPITESFEDQMSTSVVESSVSGTASEMSAGTSSGVTLADYDTISIKARGFILTNVTSLAKRLHTSVSSITDLLAWYVHGMRKLGVVYKVLDASNYTYLKKPLLGNPRHVSLTPNDPWYAYADILKDQHDYEQKERLPETEYVFIIGSDNEVPMPCMPNYIRNHDKYFDTDLLYSYPFGVEMERKLVTQDIFKYDALFYVGRFPIAEDGSLNDLRGYFERVLANECSINLTYAYAQCDPHWRNVTMAITDELAQCELFPRYRFNANIPEEDILHQGRIFTTPFVCIDPDTHEQVPKVFNIEANYIFFNMHGGGGVNTPGFCGEDLQGRGWAEGILPNILAQSCVPNIVFTQACYGGKFIGYMKCSSMVLSAMSSNTLTYVGSSRIAYGAVDAGHGSLSASDVLAKFFNHYILCGYTAGAALFQARIQTYKNRPGCPQHALTIGEFNLYGDPMVHIRKDEDCYKMASSKAAILSPNERVGIMYEDVLMDKSAGDRQSLLQQVRAAVDKNIMDISANLAKTLYAQYGIPAREPAIITRRTYNDGHKELCFSYHLPVNEGFTNDVLTITSEKGEIYSVMTTK
jgi:hypothetical protein